MPPTPESISLSTLQDPSEPLSQGRNAAEGNLTLDDQDNATS